MNVREASGPIDGRPVGSSILPASAYTDQKVFDTERQQIFESRWVWAGFTHWVAEPGSSRPVSVAGRPLLLVRDREGTLRVFHNICRHRGIVLSEQPSTRGRLRCPYHFWTFNLDGSLCGTPYWDRTKGSGPEPEVRDRLGLLPVPHSEWAGMVFVHLGEPTDSAEELLAPLAERWAPYDLTSLHLAEERRYDVDANWKLVVENFLDFYHLPFVHPQVGPAATLLDIEDQVLSEAVIGGYYPRGASAKASGQTAAGGGGGTALPLLGEIPDGLRDRQDIFCVFPNALVFIEPDFYQVIALEPVAPDRTVEHMAVFVAAEAADAAYDTARKNLSDVLFGVNDQDLPVLRALQQGRHSPAADRNHLVPHWDQITARFQHLTADALAQGATANAPMASNAPAKEDP
ncbi:aromatic ring-hydroxylating oxygenase subunit alpha [Streptomyces himalayensis]|uniref:aromatic ring-hydroxylating oxygenase subunit alpha n=1 Tax=Streptomyces himalayensis TaxID=2820085 RepID=UPI001C69466D|nr:aromatic ring-hydroxylating dioxygenase subunit alpha [Streptomyces himalayensis]